MLQGPCQVAPWRHCMHVTNDVFPQPFVATSSGFGSGGLLAGVDVLAGFPLFVELGSKYEVLLKLLVGWVWGSVGRQ